MREIYFYDLPVYRITEDAYYKDFEKHVDRILFGHVGGEALREEYQANPRRYDGPREHLLPGYGGMWRFNEIIGCIRLHFCGTQVRGEYFAVPNKIVRKSRTKRLEYLSHKLSPEVEIQQPYGNEQILHAVRQYISDCRRKLRHRHLDTEVFEQFAPNIRWENLLVLGLRSTAT